MPQHEQNAKPAHSGINVTNLSHSIEVDGGRRTLLDGISFSVHEGEFVAIIGPSGCGKSTLIKKLAGLLPQGTAMLQMGGLPIDILAKEHPTAIGYIAQFSAFHKELSVSEILNFAAAIRLPTTLEADERTKWIQTTIDLTGIGQFLDQKADTLSGGQLRRLALAEELVGNPSFFLLDELTSGLDPHSEQEMMLWLKYLAKERGKTIVLVTHNVNNLELCDRVLFLREGKCLFYGPFDQLFSAFSVYSIEELYRKAQNVTQNEERSSPVSTSSAFRVNRPPTGWEQLPHILKRQWMVVSRNRPQLIIHAILATTFPMLVALFAYNGLPQVRSLSLEISSDMIGALVEQIHYSKELFHAASLISGLAMFQVILLCLMGANNGAREIAKERDIYLKEQRVGLSSVAYLSVKYVQISIFSLIQAGLMTSIVKACCGFPGSLLSQTLIFFVLTFAVSSVCLAISARSLSPERASLLSIYLVGLQLPLSGAVLSLPESIGILTRPFIAAYWGWSGYLKSFEHYRHYDLVKQISDTPISSLILVFLVLLMHAAFSVLWIKVRR